MSTNISKYYRAICAIIFINIFGLIKKKSCTMQRNRGRQSLVCTRLVNSTILYNNMEICQYYRRKGVNSMERKEYYLGLDMGTNSIGWAVTDKDYNLIRFKGKDLWGIREFEEASTKEARRTNRSSRRRREREIARLGILKDLFHDELVKVDETFLIRLDNSKYHKEDKDYLLNNSKYGLFNDKDFTDKDYFKKYPTIFHLRKELIDNKGNHDIRLVYLAILNIFKHRGHFLNPGELSDFQPIILFDEMVSTLKDTLLIDMKSNVSADVLINELSDSNTSRTYKKEKLMTYFNVEKTEKKKIEIIKAICGLKANANIIFDELGIDKKEKVEFDFSDFSYDEKIEELISQIGDENYELIACIKSFYDSVVLSKTLKGYEYLSHARCASYNKHKEDLKILKDVYKRYLSKEKYDLMFRSEEKGTYNAYVNSVNSKSICKKDNELTHLRRNYSDRKAEHLYKMIKKDLDTITIECNEKDYILDEISKESFLPKQLTASNGIIPNQVHKKELIAILNNAKEYLPFLNNRDEKGLSVIDKLIQVFEFQIPYYVGPLGKNSKTGWAVRKDNYGNKILPWNIEEIVDMKATSQKFIERMVRKCTYITKENVHSLPKNSLMYESYSVLNEINNIKINGVRISSKLKQELYNELYLTTKKVTRTKINNFFINKGLIIDGNEISGIDINVNNQLSSYHKFKAILGDRVNEDKYKRMIEDIIFWITIYGDKKLVKEQIEAHYKNFISDSDIKKILALRFKDWGRLSKDFFELQGINKVTGECYSIIRMLWETNDNLMELLSEEKYTYLEELNKQQDKAQKLLSEYTYEDLQDTYFSAPVKRMIWQTILIMKELENVIGCPPSRVFIEMTRKHEEKKRTTTRKDKFLSLYKTVKDEMIDWKKVINDADNNGQLKSKKMYLYLTQKGRCMYTNERIELSDLFNDNLYDIDHIYPRHFVKDDNLDNNLVLVKKEKNNHKSDIFPLESTIKVKCKSMWKELLDENFISKEKYDRLISNQELNDEQKVNFIARQLVETSQGTKGIAEILKNILPKDTSIVYAKGSNVSDFRHEFKIPKSRIVNDFHHAHDAYLNIVVGNVYYTKFTQNPRNFIEKYKSDERRHHYNLSKMYKWDVERNGEVAWKAPVENGSQGTITVVKNTLKKTTPLMTRMNFEKGGQLTEATIVSHSKTKTEGYIPIKTSDLKMQDVTKYGGRTSIAGAYYFLVEHKKGKKVIRTLETVPLYLKEKVKDNIGLLEEYCINELKLVNPKILMKKINIQSLIKYNGYYLHITGRTGNHIAVRNAVNLVLNDYWIKYIHKIEKYKDTNNFDEELTVEKNIELYDILVEKHMNNIYSKRPNPVGNKLLKGKDQFINLTASEQLETLYQILYLSEIGLRPADLRTLGESNSTGKMKINKEVTKANEFILIHQSVTGIFERRIDLLSNELANNCCIK